MILDAQEIKLAVAQYLTRKRRMAVTFEVGVVKGGSLRADVFGVNLRRNVVIAEVKSSMADFRSDKKWRKYIPFCSQFYFAFEESVYQKLKKELPKDVGIIVVRPKPEGKRLYPIRVVRRAKSQEIDPEVLLDLALRMVYRTSDFNGYRKIVNGKVYKP